MALDSFTNVFAGNPLERASYRRTDEAWLAERLADPNSLALAVWNGKPLVEDAPRDGERGGGAQIAYLAAGMAKANSVGWEKLLFLGVWKDVSVFAVDPIPQCVLRTRIAAAMRAAEPASLTGYLPS
jgi:NAD+ diphosphatase